MKEKVPQGIPKVFGTAIHHMVETFFSLPHGYKSLEKFIKTWIYYWLEYTLREKYGTRIRMKNSDDPQKYLATGIQILKRFYIENLPYRTGELPKPKVEKRFDLIFKGIRTTGKIDRIQPVENNEVEIWDYKTGYKRPGEQELIRDIQFSFYNLGLLKLVGKDPIRMRLVHLNTGEQIVLPPKTESDYLQLGCWLDEARVYVQNILDPRQPQWKDLPFRWLNPEDIKRKTFSPRPSSFCGICDYDQLCREFRPRDELREWWIRQDLSRIKSQPETIQFDLPFPKKKISLKKPKSPR